MASDSGNSSPARGFTLIEVMVAMAIFAVLAVGVYRVLSVLVDSRSRVSSHAQSLQDIQKAMWVIGNDITLAVIRDIATDERQRAAAMISDEDGFALQFTRQGLRNPLLQSRSDLLRVAYSLGPEPVSTMADDGREDEGREDDSREDDAASDKHKDNDMHLLRTTWPAIDRISANEPVTQVLVRDVKSLDIEFFNDDAKWVRQWPEKKPEKNDHMRRLPHGIKLTLRTRQYGEIERVFQIGNVPQKKEQMSSGKPTGKQSAIPQPEGGVDQPDNRGEN